MHPELVVLLATLGAFLVIGLPRIRRTVSLPASIEFREVPDGELTSVQREHFADCDRRMSELGYQPVTVYRLALSAANINRLYRSALGSGIAMAYAMTGARGHVVHYYEFVQDFDDGTRLSTRNAPIASLFDRGPQDLTGSYPALQDPAELKARHEEEAARLGLVPVSARTKEEIFRVAQERHRRMCERQVELGLLSLDPQAGVYRATYRLGLRGIKNFLNPFTDNFTWARAAAALAVGVGLAAAGGYCGGRFDAQLLLCAAAGAALGAIFENKTFIWTFLIGALATRWFIPDAHRRTLACFAMAYVAHAAAAWRRSRRLRVA